MTWELCRDRSKFSSDELPKRREHAREKACTDNSVGNPFGNSLGADGWLGKILDCSVFSCELFSCAKFCFSWLFLLEPSSLWKRSLQEQSEKKTKNGGKPHLATLALFGLGQPHNLPTAVRLGQPCFAMWLARPTSLPQGGIRAKNQPVPGV